MAEATGRLQVEYFDGSNWIALVSSGNSLILELEITDTLFNPQTARIKVADLKNNGIFAASSTNSVLKEFMNIRILDPTRYIIYFSGKIFRIAKKFQVPYGEVLDIVCYDALYSLANEFLDSDSGDDDVEAKSSTLISNWIGNHVSTSLLSVTNDSGDVDRFETSSFNRANTTKVVKAGRSQMSVLSAILQEALQDQILTELDRGYMYYVDPNFTSTATTHNPAGFLTYYARNRMPASEAGVTGDAVPLANGLTIEKPSGASIVETNQKHIMMGTLDISSANRELITDIIASYYHEETGKRVSKRFSIIHFTAHSGMSTAQYDDISFDAEVGTGGSNISNLVDSGGNVIGRIQYISSLTAFPAYMILSDRTSHALVAGETLSADSHGSGASITLSSVATIGSQFVYEPKAVWGVTKTIKSHFNKESDANEIRTKLAGIFEGRQNVPDRMSFTTSQLPYYWAEGRATSSTTGATLHDSAVVWETKGVRTGATFLKLSGTGGTIAAYGHVSSLTDAGVITCTLNTGSWATNDYYRWQVRVRAGHQVHIVCVPKGISGESQLVTKVVIRQNMGSQTVTSWETQGGAARSMPTALAESSSSDATHSAVDVGASAPVPIGGVLAHFEGKFTVGAKSSPDGTRHLAVNWNKGSGSKSQLKINKTLSIDSVESDVYNINHNDTTSLTGYDPTPADGNGNNLRVPAALTPGTEYTLYFDPDTDPDDFQIAETTDFQSVDRSRLIIAIIKPVASTGNIGGDADSESECLFILAGNIVLEGAAAGEAGPSMKLGVDYFAVNGIQAKHMLTIGSDATADERFKFYTPSSSPTSASSTHWFRGFTGNSSSDTTGKWFEFDVANKALNFYDGAATSKLLSKFSGTGVTFYDGSAASATTASTLATLTGSGLTFFNGSGSGAGNETVAVIGNNSTSANNGLFVYGITTNAFSEGSANVVTWQSDQASPTNYAYMGMYTSSSTDMITISADAAEGIYLFANKSRNSGTGSIWLAPDSDSGGVTIIGQVLHPGTTVVGHTFRMPSVNTHASKRTPIDQIWVFPTTAPTAGQYLEADEYGSTQTQLQWSDPTKHSTATASGSVPTSAYGTFKYALDGNGASVPTLGFASGQTNATPASATAQSSFWSMLSESDGSTGSNLIFEPIVDYDSSDTTKNRAYIGWHNPLFGIYSYYLNGGDGNASFPSHTFSTDLNTGMYLASSDNIALSTGGYARVNIYNGGLYPSYDNLFDLGHASYQWDDIYATNTTIQTSDGRLKEQITPTTLGLDFVNDLNPVSYKWKKKKENKMDQIHYGIIAQEVMETLKKYGVDSVEGFGGITHGGGEEDHYGARYGEFVPILIKAVQELSDKVKELKEKN
jgi:hypothetical protein